MSDLTATFFNKIAFHLQLMSAQSAEGLDKMELLLEKVEQVVSKLGRLTDEAESSEIKVESDQGTEESLSEEMNEEVKKVKDWLSLLLSYWSIALFVLLLAVALATGSLVNIFN